MNQSGYSLFLDSSGNKNHLKSITEIPVNNRQSITLAGEPYLAGIRSPIETKRLSLENVDFEVADYDLRFNVPVFKSEIWTYRRWEKYQNDLIVSSMWVDFLMNVEVPSYHSYMKNWIPSIHSYEGTSLYVNHLFLTDEYDHSHALSGECGEVTVSFRTQPFIQHETFLRFRIIGSCRNHRSSL